ncbi:MAG TPA: GNAT family N-acetyltransferase [Candidatus Eremiobacteraceae bacterium]|nr:GNAT family N-acetyltransferase [Candidatus Eremiobacteraceae bacterium]
MADIVSYRLLSMCTPEDAVFAWNVGFAGYYSDLTMSAESLSRRMDQDGIVPEASILAFAGDRPVGIVLNAIADVHGIRQAWNGGTAVAQEHRGTGVAREMLRRSVGLYAEHRVRLATLEALSQNSRAIALYAKNGYRLSGTLHGLAAQHPRIDPVDDGQSIEFVAPERLTSVPFYQKRASWPTLWPNARGAIAVIAAKGGVPSAFILFRRAPGARGAPVIRILKAECADDGTALRAALGALLAHHRDVAEYLAYNVPASNAHGLRVLREAGFEPVWDQVWMTREFVT